MTIIGIILGAGAAIGLVLAGIFRRADRRIW